MKTIKTIKSQTLLLDAFIELDNDGYSNGNLFEDFVVKHKILCAPDHLIWSYNFFSQKFDLLNTMIPYGGIIRSEKLFISKIKPCFRSLFYASVNNYISLLAQKAYSPDSELCIIVPFKIEPDVYYTTKITVTPLVVLHRVLGFVIKLVPVSLYDDANFNSFIVSNAVYKKDETRILKKQLVAPKIKFTPKQNKILNYIHSGLTSTEIASQESKAINSIYKINRIIIEKVSKYYEMEFKDAKEAVNFYFNSFT